MTAPFAEVATRLQQAMEVLSRELHDAMEATQEDFALAPPQPACPPVGDGDFPQVNGTPPQEDK